MIKNIIDLIEIQHKTLYDKNANKRKERSEMSMKNYGCVMSNFFLFKLENDIFTYSSKETDKFKLFKINNILTYIMISFINEINLSQILYLTYDKLVNYFLFEKFGFGLFDNLYIRTSNSNDISPIKNYKILCYIIYYLSGIYAKFDMWYADNIPVKPNNINPQIQRFAIHTFVDCLNSILEINSKSNSNYLYSMFATKFFNKLALNYSNIVSSDVIQQLEALNKKKVFISSNNKLKYISKSIEPIKLLPYNYDGFYILKSELGTRSSVASYPNLRIITKKLNEVNQKEFLGPVYNEILEKLHLETLKKIATLYDENGNKRNTVLTINDIKHMTMEELKAISETTRKQRLKNQIVQKVKIEKKLEKINTTQLSNLAYIDNLKKSFNKEIHSVIHNFILKLEKLIGPDININNSNYYLLYDVYEIDHDYRANKKTPIFIKANDKIKFKKNDPYFNQDIYYYSDQLNQVTLYYSAVEKFLIGYKENSRDYVKVLNSDCYLKIHLSILNQLRLLGFNYTNYKLNKFKPEPEFEEHNKTQLMEFVNNILRVRLQHLKNSLSNIQQIIYQIKNNFTGPNLNQIAKFYQSKLKSFNTYDADGLRIFKDWNLINSSLFYKPIPVDSNIRVIELPNKSKFIQSDNLMKFISSDDIILYYIIQQFEMLLDINTDEYTQNNLTYLIINIIMQLFKNFTNCEFALYDINVKKFFHYINTKIEVAEIHDEINLSNLTEEEIEKIKDEQDMDKERLDALDADQGLDEEETDFGDEDVLLQDRTSGEY
jgi:hypothetical protein